MRLRLIGFVVGGFLAAAVSASADVHLSIQNGRVTLVTRDATMRQILTEWAKVGQVKIADLERIAGGPMTLQLTNVPEGQALDIVLRSVSGYIAIPRGTDTPNASVFDRIFIMPTSVAPVEPARALRIPDSMLPGAFQRLQPPSDVGVDGPVSVFAVPDPTSTPAGSYSPPQLVIPNGSGGSAGRAVIVPMTIGWQPTGAPWRMTFPNGVGPNELLRGVSAPGAAVPQGQPPKQAVPPESPAPAAGR